jgi:hypothetical protein
MRLASCNADNANDELSNYHAQSTPDENTAAAIRLDHVEAKRGGANVDEGDDKGDQEGVADCAQAGEKGSIEINNEVDTSQLLHHLHQDPNSGTTAIAIANEDTAFETVSPAANVTY